MVWPENPDAPESRLLPPIKNRPLIFHQEIKQMKPALFGWKYFMKMNAPFSYALFSAKLVNYLKAWWAAGQRLNFQLIDWKSGGAAEPIIQRVGSKAKWSALIISRAAGSGLRWPVYGSTCIFFFCRRWATNWSLVAHLPVRGEDAPIGRQCRHINTPIRAKKIPVLDVNVRWVVILGENWMIMKLSLTAAVAQRIPKLSSYVLHGPPPPLQNPG